MHKQKEIKVRFTTAFIAALLSLSASLAFAEPSLFLGLPPIMQSEAFMQFEKRPVSELSKLYYLISRFGACDIDINYDGSHYNSRFVAPFVTMYLTTHYRKDDSAKKWILSYCHRTLTGDKIIWATMPDGTKCPASDALLRELDNLEKQISKPAV